ncbi:act minimal PKS chain-length factor (CLF/KS beta) [Nocardia transvalensis]|uniref:Act minimal PKS chain-length factor (CLF/KS beta) n=1 Tax=Nocardia transvalensis TaxID=37333 RepID=A0A7W9PLF1_9NOCA|nr:ketosynthase chain-length factor [Nocardia transvalensis]MBB5918326.1 act minimal PKS chain-length factor (CLF/KS beta) [Nocardia transvalensis]
MTTTVVTGLGVAAPNGVGTEDYWQATLAGRNGIGPIELFDARPYPVTLAGEVDLDAAAYVPGKFRAQTDHMTQLAMAATVMALEDSGVAPSELPEFDMGITVANSSGGIMFGQRELQQLWSRGPSHVSAYMAVAWFYAATAGQLSIRHGMKGPTIVLAAEQAGGLDAVGHARRQVRRGTPIMVTGGSDASLSPGGLAFQIGTGLLSTRSDPDRAYLPFDRDACGYLPGNGGAVLVLEDADAARARGQAGHYGEITGYAATFDRRDDSGEPGAEVTAYDPPRGSRVSRLRRAIELALADAEIAPADVDVVFADASGLRTADLEEAAAVTAVFGVGGVPVTAPKTMTGRLYAAGGALDLVTALLAIRDGVIPPTVNVTSPAPGIDLDLVLDEPRPQRIRNALVLARGLGGFNSAVVVSAPK